MGETLLQQTAKIPEVTELYKLHQPVLLTARMNNEDEMKSRMAFVDTFQSEFQLLHQILKQYYQANYPPPKGKPGEFGYLADSDFRKEAERSSEKFLNFVRLHAVPLYSNLTLNVTQLDMMKDYMSYQYAHNAISRDAYESCLKHEPQAEQDFRLNTMENRQKWDFLLNPIPPDQTKNQNAKAQQTDEVNINQACREGLRECRKWMYRNCPKSGLLNDTGSKRNYVDAFMKRPLLVQLDTLYQIENKLHLDPTLTNTTKPDYVPNVKKLKKAMLYSRWTKYINPYHLYREFSGNAIRWQHMENALIKAEILQKNREPNDIMCTTACVATQDPKLNKTVVAQTPNTQQLIEATFNHGTIAQSIAGGAVSVLEVVYPILYQTKSVASTVKDASELKILNTIHKISRVSGAIAIGAGGAAFLVSTARAFQCTNDMKKADQIMNTLKGMERTEGSKFFQSMENGRIYDMAKLTKSANNGRATYYTISAASNAAWLTCAVPTFFGVASFLGPIGAAVTLTGTIGKFIYDHYDNKKQAEMAVIVAMKTEELEKNEPEKNKELLNKQDDKKCIDPYIASHQELLNKKMERFPQGHRGRKILKEYLNSPQKIKDRVLENWVVQHGHSSIYLARERLQTENYARALRYVLLKNPTGSVTKENLLTALDRETYFDEAKQEGDYGKNLARTRKMFKQLLDLAMIDSTLAETVEEACKRLNIIQESPPNDASKANLAESDLQQNIVLIPIGYLDDSQNSQNSQNSQEFGEGAAIIDVDVCCFIAKQCQTVVLNP